MNGRRQLWAFWCTLAYAGIVYLNWKIYFLGLWFVCVLWK